MFIPLLTCGYLFAYGILRLITRKYPKSDVGVNFLMSMIACYIFLYNRNTDYLFEYYLYDLVISFVSFDYIMIIHHFITIYAITPCYDLDDYTKALQVLTYMKASDIFMHHYKIINGFELDRYKILAYWQFYSILLTIMLWCVFRIVIPLSYLPLKLISSNVLLIALVLANVIWIIKFWNLLYKIPKRIREKWG